MEVEKTNLENKKIKSIELVFENCETVVLKPEHITFLSIEDISKDLYINNSIYKDLKIHEDINCKTLFLVINQKGLNQKTSFYESFKTRGEEETQKFILKNRLNLANDITSICLNFDENGEDSIQIYVPWQDSNSEYVNDYQKTETDDNGDVKIIIKKTK